MSEVDRCRERDHDLRRYLTFIDAVAAIALTLLVLPLSDLGAALDHGRSVAELLRDHESQILAFGLSFAVIANLWFVQYRAMRPVIILDRAVARMLLVWIFSIVVLPFCTELVAQASDDPITKICYFGAIAVSEASIGVAVAVIRRRPETIDPAMAINDGVGAWVTVGLLIMGLVFSLTIPLLGYWPLLLLIVGSPVRGLLKRRATSTSSFERG